MKRAKSFNASSRVFHSPREKTLSRSPRRQSRAGSHAAFFEVLLKGSAWGMVLGALCS